jgi:rRNA maturation RNase YbeY
VKGDFKNFDIVSERGVRFPSFAYEDLRNEVLGEGYALSLAFIGEATARKANKATRGKTYTPNVLSFPLSKRSGEILICPKVAKRQAKDYGLTPDEFVGKLFIHGLFHLKGRQHGSRMESEERRIAKKFHIF